MKTHGHMFHHDQAHKLDDPERQRWLPIADVLERLRLRSGMDVADVGAGTGYFALPIAKVVAPSGRVLAVDLQKEMLTLLRAKLGELPIALVEGSAEHTTLPDASVDLVLLANVWHEIDDTKAALAEARRILRPEGRVAVLDWRTDVEQPFGPSLAHRVSASDAAKSLRAAGFDGPEPESVGPYSYLIVSSGR